MRILISNNDGTFRPCLATLADATADPRPNLTSDEALERAHHRHPCEDSGGPGLIPWTS